MKRMLITALLAMVMAACLGLNTIVTAKRFDKASPKLAGGNETTKERGNVDVPGHRDFVKSKDNSTHKNPGDQE